MRLALVQSKGDRMTREQRIERAVRGRAEFHRWFAGSGAVALVSIAAHSPVVAVIGVIGMSVTHWLCRACELEIEAMR